MVRKAVKIIFDSTFSCYSKVIKSSEMDENKKLKRQRHNQKEHGENSRASPPFASSQKP